MTVRALAYCLTALSLVGCVRPLELGNRSCPCSTGWQCCGDTCLPAGESCTPPSSQGPISAPAPDMATAVACTPPTGGTRRQLVIRGITVPQLRTDFGFDLNGDGRVDNQLGNIIGAFAGSDVNSQSVVTQAIADGNDVELLEERSLDPQLIDDDCAALTVVAGLPQASPDFSGAGSFTPDPSVVPAEFSGPLMKGAFAAAPAPAVTRTPVQLRLLLPIIDRMVPVTLVGARIALDNSTLTGQINGAVRSSEVQGVIVPAIAAGLNARVQADPSSSLAMQLLTIFDTGGKPNVNCPGTCANPDGSCARAMDGHIDVCEIATSGLIENVLAPDVQMFDANGDYHPNPLNTKKDCLSVGIAFSAVGARFSGAGAVTFSAIQTDFDAHACSNIGCHGPGGSGAAVFPIKPNPTAQADIEANYAAVQNEINTTTGNEANSLILTKNLVGGVTHAGGNTLFPSTLDPLYLKWLSWIKAGAPKW
jgi:hypothetical protein